MNINKTPTLNRSLTYIMDYISHWHTGTAVHGPSIPFLTFYPIFSSVYPFRLRLPDLFRPGQRHSLPKCSAPTENSSRGAYQCHAVTRCDPFNFMNHFRHFWYFSVANQNFRWHSMNLFMARVHTDPQISIKTNSFFNFSTELRKVSSFLR